MVRFVALALLMACGSARAAEPPLVARARVQPRWSADGKALTYSVTTATGDREHVRIELPSGKRTVSAKPFAADAAAGPAPRRSEMGDVGTRIEFRNQTAAPLRATWWDDRGRPHDYGAIPAGESFRQNTYVGHAWSLFDSENRERFAIVADDSGGTYTIRAGTPPVQRDRPSGRPSRSRPSGGGASPDGKWTAFLDGPNVKLREAATGKTIALSTDGTAADPYSGEFHWSPDGKKLVAMRVKPAQKHPVTFIESSPAGQVQPRVRVHDYLKPGDVIAHPRPRLFDVAQRRMIPVAEDLFPNPWSITRLEWAADSGRFTFLYNQRGHQVLRLVAVDAATGKAIAAIDETSPTFIDYNGKSFLQLLADGRRTVWMSERDGWNHLWLMDTVAGKPIRCLTPGAFAVLGVERVDEKRGEILFWAGGLHPVQSPYHRHLAKAALAGGPVQPLTEGDGTHEALFAPDGEHFVDRWSRVDQPPTTELRRLSDGKRVCLLETAATARLLATGWRPPERFVAKGRDGKTDIHGVIVRPKSFDPKRKYPVVEEIYAGPHGHHAPVAWQGPSRMDRLADDGFILVMLDGMGTSGRSKAFHDVCWKNLADAGFPDRKAWIRAAAATRPWMDLTRVGIYGGSAGGQNAMRALLDHHDLYKVAVADCGCHDNRMDKIWWNELWMGWPVGPEYAASSNVDHAGRLKGKLLLIVGELDENVDPASTMQVAAALQKANIDHELLIVAGAGHGAAGTPFGGRKQREFLKRNLLVK